MTYLMQVVLDGANKPARAVVVDAKSGDIWHVLAPEAVPSPGPSIGPPQAHPADAMETALAQALRSTTELHPTTSPPTRHKTLADALESADRELAGRKGRVPRNLPPADLDLFHSTKRQIESVYDSLSRLPQEPVQAITDYVRGLLGELKQIRDWVDELATRELEPRTSTAMPNPKDSPNARLVTLDLPAPVRSELQEIDLYTLSDVIKEKKARPVLERYPDTATVLVGYAGRAGLEPPSWLLELTAADRIWVGTVLADLQDLPAHVKRPLAVAGIDTVGDLTARTHSELSAVQGLGTGRIAQIEELLQRYGYALTPEPAAGGRPRAGGGIGQVVKVLHPNGDAFVRTESGSIYVPVGEVKRLGVDIKEGWILRFDKIESDLKGPRAKGLSLAVPTVVGTRLDTAREVLLGQQLSVDVDAPFGAERISDSALVKSQSPAPGEPYRAGATVTLGL